MVSIWWLILLVYAFFVGFAATGFLYSRGLPRNWFDEFVIGLLGLLWPVVFLAWSVGRFVKILGFWVVDPLLEWLSQKVEKGPNLSE